MNIGTFIAILLGLLGSVIGFVISSTSYYNVGECVRELGYDRVEKITVVTKGGAIETEYISKYTDRVVKEYYYGDKVSKLIKVECE